MSFNKQAQDYHSKTPLIILGSGASAAYGMPGMRELADYLIGHDLSAFNEKLGDDGWSKFTSLLKEGIDLESALYNTKLSEKLTSEIIKATWLLINSKDEEIFSAYLEGKIEFKLCKLLAHIFRTSNSVIDILTTNYDRLAEYACDAEGLYHYTGFTAGFYRSLMPQNSITSQRKVNIWKVHGSIDWFRNPNEDIVALPHRSSIPEYYHPQIVTPGGEKYHRTHLPPYRDIINNADQAITRAASYLCIGYGFNDEHIQPKLMEKCARQNAPITLLTRNLSDAAKKNIINGSVQNYLAIERGEHSNQSIIHSSISGNSTVVEDNFWSLEGYLKLLM